MLFKEIWEAELKTNKIPFTDSLNLISALVDPPTVRSTQSCFNVLSSLQAAQLVVHTQSYSDLCLR